MKRAHLIQLFDAKKVNEAIDAMQGYNQLDLESEELRLSPFMLKYVKQTINEEEEFQFMSQIAEFYCQFLMLQFKVNSASDLSKSVVD